MMKKRKFGTGGMPSIGESVKSGNRLSGENAKDMKAMTPKKRTMPSVDDIVWHRTYVAVAHVLIRRAVLLPQF